MSLIDIFIKKIYFLLVWIKACWGNKDLGKEILIINKGGHGDLFIMLKAIREQNFLIDAAIFILTNESNYNSFKNVNLKNVRWIKNIEEIENKYFKVMCSLRSDLQAAKELWDYNVKINFMCLNPIYDDLRLYSRIRGFISKKWKKKYYSKKHMGEIFSELIRQSNEEKNPYQKNELENKNKRKIQNILVHVGGSSKARSIRPEVVLELIKKLPEYKITITGGTKDRLEYPAELFQELDIKYEIGLKNIKEQLDSNGNYDLIICPDSMFVHYADYFNIPVVALMGPALPGTYGPTYAHSEILFRNPICSPCKVNFCNKFNGYSCLQDISAEEIVVAVNKINNK